MRYLAAYVLGTLSGKEPTNTDLEKILSSVGIEYDSSRLEKIVSELKGKSIDDLISKGQSKLSTVPMGGGGGGGVAVAAPAAGAAASAAAPAEEKKEEKKPEKEDSESDDDMGFGLFD